MHVAFFRIFLSIYILLYPMCRQDYLYLYAICSTYRIKSDSLYNSNSLYTLLTPLKVYREYVQFYFYIVKLGWARTVILFGLEIRMSRIRYTYLQIWLKLYIIIVESSNSRLTSLLTYVYQSVICDNVFLHAYRNQSIIMNHKKCIVIAVNSEKLQFAPNTIFPTGVFCTNKS